MNVIEKFVSSLTCFQQLFTNYLKTEFGILDLHEIK